MSIGGRLESERVRIGFSQSDLAKAGGTTRKTQFNYESGDTPPKADYLQKLAVLGVDVQYVITGCRGNIESGGGMVIGESGVTYDTGNSREEMRLLKLYRAAPSEIQKAAIRVLGG